MATDTRQLSFPSVAQDGTQLTADGWPPEELHYGIIDCTPKDNEQQKYFQLTIYSHSRWQSYRWQGKVSVNTTNIVIQSINTQIEIFLFSCRCMFLSSWDHHQAVIMIEQLKLFELPNMDPYLVQHIRTTILQY
jgi:hypothetical protein